MTVTTAFLTNAAYGYPTRGAVRRHTPHILAVVHQTATTPYDGQAMALRNQRNGAGYEGNTATYYVDQDGAAVHAVDGTKYVSWCSAPEKISYVDPTRPSMATVKQHFAAGFNPNECVWEQFECVGTGTEPWSAAQFEFVARMIAARAKLSGLPINRETVVPHRDMNTVNRPSDPWPGATREARMATLIARAKALGTVPVEVDMALGWKITAFESGTLTIKEAGVSAIRLSDGVLIAQNVGTSRPYAARIQLDVPYPGAPGGLARQDGFLIGERVCILLATNVTAIPNPAAPVVDVAAAIEADRLKAHITWQA